MEIDTAEAEIEQIISNSLSNPVLLNEMEHELSHEINNEVSNKEVEEHQEDAASIEIFNTASFPEKNPSLFVYKIIIKINNIKIIYICI
jgi:uncharacterized protein YcbX